jgi:hypothetical protein
MFSNGLLLCKTITEMNYQFTTGLSNGLYSNCCVERGICVLALVK